MKAAAVFQCLLLTVACLLAMPLKSEGISAKTYETSPLYNKNNADHLLLVAFKDASIKRMPNTATGYRQRGSYSSSTWSEEVSEQIAHDYHLQKLTEWPMTEVGVHCVVYQVALNESVADTLKNLSQDQRVDIAQTMHVFNTKTHEGNDPYHTLQANLQSMHIDQAHRTATGKNITIAMIDTGVDRQHPDLSGQISQNENFAEGISASFDNDKHGTAVAGVMIAKKDNGIGIVGIAPDARLIALKACWPDSDDTMSAACNSFTLALAVNAAIKSGADILNMSLSGPQDPILELLLNKAIAEGMIVVAADNGQSSKESNFPASMPNVISVQSCQPAANAAQNISAPGDKILTTLPHSTYDFISGSSISAAEVSGIIALLLELKGDLSIAEAKTLLQQATLGILANINANQAVSALCMQTHCPSENVSLAHKILDWPNKSYANAFN